MRDPRESLRETQVLVGTLEGAAELTLLLCKHLGVTDHYLTHGHAPVKYWLLSF